MKKLFYLLTALAYMFITTSCIKENEPRPLNKGNVIFIHPDGTGLATWNALRLLEVGPDAKLNWDKLSNIGLYRSHTKNSLTTSSHAGATMHSYGVKVDRDSYGMNHHKKLTALSGKQMSIMQEAMAAGVKVGIVNSGSIIEPGTGVFVASDSSRRHYEAITRKIIESGAEVIMSGGEGWMLPKGTQGKFGEGKRNDNLNLIDAAKSMGYSIVYTKDELKNLPDDTEKVLGVFAYEHTFNDQEEEVQAELGLNNYLETAPSVSEMTEAAVKILSRENKQFFLVVEEEGTDNFGNHLNANGMLEALKRSDEAIGVAVEYYSKNPNTLIVVASDSEAGGMEVIGDPVEYMNPGEPASANDPGGAPIDGIAGTQTKPFMSKPDQFGNSFPFIIVWSSVYDTYGSVVAKAHGLNSDLMKANFDNTDIYRLMYATLFGKRLD
ncbi:MAG: alkaline phosphatase [Melioribacteraceae bacterium]|nr:alkaline phosphatase [Melioribacteraceae bacterium]MCF8353644.1 alkaline phosphatase [Melioribacteraceae bacterium]MCF8393414.1 alkaline phosphatase [Melioribacteraceae bacterium]MCF8419271.1 alkaline phosphatase [Melioribacteraceae bacterium]